MQHILYVNCVSDTLMNLSALVVLCWSLYGFLYILSCHLHIMTNLPLPYQFEYLLFIFLYWLLRLGLLTLCQRELVKVSILVLFQTLAGKTLFFILEYYIGCEFVINSFYYVEICSLCTHFAKSFYHKWILNFIGCFLLYFLRWSCRFVFSFAYVVYHIDGFAHIEPCDWDESYLIVVYDLLYVLLDSVSYTLLGIFASIFIKDIGL